MSLKNWLCVAVAVALSAVGASEAEVDVYAIRNPTNALQALRAKWRGVESRVSMWKMPDFTRKFLEIDGTQRWWEKDKKNRYYPFSTACLNAIGMRIEPPVWFYNLACARAVNGQHEEAVEALEKAVGGLGVREKRLWERFGVAPRNHSQTDIALDCDCVSTGEAAAKRSLESCAAGVRALPR